MKHVLSLALALFVSLTVLAGASPALAGAGDERACVTTREYQQIKRGMSKRDLILLLEGRGQAAGAKKRKYRKCDSRARVVVRYSKKFTSPGVRVKGKRLVNPKPKAKPSGGGGNGGGGGSHAPVSTYDCPQNAPIKGNEGSMIYHPPSSPWYDQTTPEQCFATEADALAAGFRRANY